MKEKLKTKLSKLVDGFKNLPDKKHHLDFLAALLSIPVLLSVILLNYTNLNNLQKSKTSLTPVPTASVSTSPTQQIIVVPQDNNAQQQSSPSAILTPASCQKAIGPVSITYPAEGQTVSDNPLCVNISYDNTNYCSVVWSYSINGGPWSNFTGNNPCIYNLPNGNVKFNLRVQSTVVQTEVGLTRNFVYGGSVVATPTPSPASSSAVLQ